MHSFQVAGLRAGGRGEALKFLAKLAPFDLPPAPKLTNQPWSALQPYSGAKAFARYVPERADDIAWENDRIAFRLYGPALEKHEKTGSGIDVWCKATRALVVNAWYKGGHYHKDTGEGCDCYHVGQTRGCGGLGIWADGKLFVSHVWKEFRISDDGPEVARFNLVYAPWDAAGREVSETRQISLIADSNLNRCQSTITSPQSGPLTVAVGIAIQKTHGHLVQDKEHGFLSYWDDADGGAATNGSIGCAIVFDPAQFAGFAETPLDHLVLLKVTPGKPFVYYAGAGWSKSLDFKSEEDWLKYVREYKPGFHSSAPTSPSPATASKAP